MAANNARGSREPVGSVKRQESGPSESEKLWPWGLVGLVGLVVVVLLVTGATYRATHHFTKDDVGGSCRVDQATSPGEDDATSSPEVASAGVLRVRPEQDSSLDFGRATGGGSLNIALEVLSDPDPPGALKKESVLVARLMDLRKEGSPNELHLDEEQSVGGASVRFMGDTWALQWCVNRKAPRPAAAWAPGVYEGDLIIDDDRVEPLTVPVTMTLSHAGVAYAVMWLPIVGAAALVMTWNIRAKRDPHRAIFSNKFWKWLVTVEGVISSGAGIVAMIAVFNSTYLTATAFGAASWDWLVLIGALYVAFVGAASTVAIAAPSASTGDKT